MPRPPSKATQFLKAIEAYQTHRRETRRLKVAVRLMRILARVVGGRDAVVRFDAECARLDAMTPEEREAETKRKLDEIRAGYK
jgi:hypothetical protein